MWPWNRLKITVAVLCQKMLGHPRSRFFLNRIEDNNVSSECNQMWIGYLWEQLGQLTMKMLSSMWTQRGTDHSGLLSLFSILSYTLLTKCNNQLDSSHQAGYLQQTQLKCIMNLIQTHSSPAPTLDLITTFFILSHWCLLTGLWWVVKHIFEAIPRCGWVM